MGLCGEWFAMDESQSAVPDSFVALFLRPGSHKPSLPRAEILQRYELCEDMAQMLTETARIQLMDLGVAEEDVLERVHAGLSASDTVGADEALWVVRRLAELLLWDLPPALEWRVGE